MKALGTDLGTIHFVGIGGIGMSGIAEVMHQLGYKVQGSDIAENYVIEKLRKAGIPVTIGHSADNLGEAAVVVCSSAIKDGNPEVEAAAELRLPRVRRAEMLAELMRMQKTIAVAGTHGKTTTTGLLTSALLAAGADPSYDPYGRAQGKPQVDKAKAALEKARAIQKEVETPISRLLLTEEFAGGDVVKEDGGFAGAAGGDVHHEVGLRAAPEFDGRMPRRREETGGADHRTRRPGAIGEVVSEQFAFVRNDDHVVLENVNLEVAEHEFVTIVGPSGLTSMKPSASASVDGLSRTVIRSAPCEVTAASVRPSAL